MYGYLSLSFIESKVIKMIFYSIQKMPPAVSKITWRLLLFYNRHDNGYKLSLF
ncbi:hypothetical protein PE36_06432 [Moritella sp. PE36]|nr:hypothetical protein PE36_06432 [Moritella sp. PE36]